MILTGSLFQDFAIISVTVLVTIVTFFKWRYQYWKQRNVPQLEPKVPFGDFSNPLKRKENFSIRLKHFYDTAKSRKWKHLGLYFTASPNYLLVDLDYIKNVLTKDFQHFVDRGFYYNEKDDPLSAHLFSIGGVKWRNLRTKLTPTFTSGKMKMMFQTLVDCEANLQKIMARFHENREVIDIKEVLARFTTDIIGSCAFGLDLKSFEDEDSLFREYGRKFFAASSRWRIIRRSIIQSFPDLAKTLRLKVTPDDISDFFIKTVRDNIEYREKNGVTRKDFMQLLIELKNNKLTDDDGYKHDGKSLTVEEIAAQSFVFFLAGFETSSTTMTFALYELARHQDIQDKVRDEIKQVLDKYDGKLSYEAIQEMKYMQQVIDETLRKYPPVPFITRQCVKDYKLPDEDVIIEKGTMVLVPIYGVHHDGDLYPDPEKFEPERFSEDNKKLRHQYAHIPFGEGPRLCIGMRFGLMQSKVGLTSLLKKYKFFVNKKTKEPLKMRISSFILAAEGEIWLDAKKI